jgi:hypothetical protein
MAYQFNDDDKAEREFTEKLPYGISKVQLVGATDGETDDGRDWIDLEITNADGIEDTARVWFTGKAAPYSFNTLRQIAVHNGKDDAAKEEMRQAVEACTDTAALAELLNAKVAGGELWFTKYLDPTRTWVDNDGNERQSVNRNVYGYEPKLKPELMPKQVGGEEISRENIDKIFPGGDKPADDSKPTNTVPAKF